MRTNHYLSKLQLGDLTSCFVCEQNFLFDNSNAGTSLEEFYMLRLRVFARMASMLRFLGTIGGGVRDDQDNFIQTITIASVVRIAPLRIRGVCR